MAPFTRDSIKFIFLPLAILLLAGTARNDGPNGLFLCMHCTDGITGSSRYVETYLDFQAANGNRAVGIGSGYVVAEEKVKRAEKQGIQTQGRGPNRSLFVSQFSDRKPEETAKQAAKRIILAQLKSLDRSKPVTIHISDHGWNGGMSGIGKLPPEKSGMVISTASPLEREADYVLTHEEFGDLLVQAGLTGPNAPPLRITAEHCYGGGIHVLTKRFSNVCTAAFTDNENLNWNSDDEAGAMWRYVADRKKLGKASSLVDGFYAGWSVKNREDSVGAALGSTQYVKDILAKKKLPTKPLPDETTLDWSAWSNYTTLSGRLIRKGEPQGESRAVAACPSDFYPLPGKTASRVFADAESVLDRIFPERNAPVLKIYREALSDLQRNESKYRALVEEYLSRLEEMRKKWDGLSLKEKAIASRSYTDSIGDFFDWSMGQFGEKKKADLARAKHEQASFMKEFSEFTKTHGETLLRYFKSKEYVENFSKLKTFTDAYVEGKVSEKEMNEYRRMVQCESLPL